MNATFSETACLIDAATVRAITGRDSETLTQMAEGQSLFGAFNWVWNVAQSPTGRAERRFWLTEVIAPDKAAGLDLPVVLQKILGGRHSYRAAEAGQLLMVDDMTIFRLHRAGLLQGPIVGRTRHITRDSLEQFLTERLILK